MPLAALLAVKRRWHAVTGFCLAGAALAVISVGLVGWSGVMDYVKLVSWMDRVHYTIAPANMANIRGLAETASGFAPAVRPNLFIVPLISLALYAWAVFLWKGEWQPRSAAFDLAFSHTVVVSLLLSYHLYTHDLILLIIPLVIIFECVIRGRTRSPVALPGFLISLFVVYSSVPMIRLLKADQFAWAAIALFALALLLAIEIACTTEKDMRLMESLA